MGHDRIKSESGENFVIKYRYKNDHKNLKSSISITYFSAILHENLSLGDYSEVIISRIIITIFINFAEFPQVTSRFVWYFYTGTMYIIKKSGNPTLRMIIFSASLVPILANMIRAPTIYWLWALAIRYDTFWFYIIL